MEKEHNYIPEEAKWKRLVFNIILLAVSCFISAANGFVSLLLFTTISVSETFFEELLSVLFLVCEKAFQPIRNRPNLR